MLEVAEPDGGGTQGKRVPEATYRGMYDKKEGRISDGNFVGQVESVTFVKSVKVNAERCRITFLIEEKILWKV